MSSSESEEFVPPIPFRPVVDENDKKQVDLFRKVDDVKKHGILPRVHTSDLETFLQSIYDFEDLCSPTQFHLTTGALRHEFYRQSLSGLMRTKYDTHWAEHPNTVAGHKATLRAMLSDLCDQEDFLVQKKYIQKYRKPNNMSVDAYEQRISWILLLMRNMDGAPNNGIILTDDEDKQRLFDAMSRSVRNIFRGSGMTIHNTTKRDMLRFFKSQYKILDRAHKHRVKNSCKEKPYKSSRDDKFINKSDSRERYTKRPKIENADVCPFHQHCANPHTWRYCFGNPDGNNYRPNYRLPTRLTIDKTNDDKTNKEEPNKQKTGSDRRQDTFHQDDDPDTTARRAGHHMDDDDGESDHWVNQIG
jgi:hypothetical protein